jgi:hypothetical protein
MLQDVEQGRPLELQALVGAVLELGVITGVPTPTIQTRSHALASLLARTLQHPGCAWHRSAPGLNALHPTSPIPHDNTVHDPGRHDRPRSRRHCHRWRRAGKPLTYARCRR